MTADNQCEMIALLQDILFELKGLRRDIKEFKEQSSEERRKK